MSELIIVFSAFSLILILIYSWAVLVEAASLLTEAVSQYFFWLLLSEKFSSFLSSLRDIFFGYIVDYSDKILCIFCAHSGSCSYPLYRIIIVFVCSLWSNLSDLEVFSDN